MTTDASPPEGSRATVRPSEDTGEDGPGRPSNVRRVARAAGAIAVAAGLAGCGSQGGPSADDPGGTSTNPGGTPPSSGTGTTPGAGTTGTTDACAASRGDLESQIHDVESQIASVKETIASDTHDLARLKGLRGHYPGGFDDGTLARAKSVGIAARESVLVVQFETGGGTGWFVDEHHVITNSHVASEEGDPVGWTVDGQKLALERVDRDSDWSPDVAVLRTDATGTPLSTGASGDLEPTQPLVSVGHPLGGGNWVLSLGRYLWKKARSPFSPGGSGGALWTSNPGRQGVSGSPLLTLDGEVVGLTWGGAPRREERNLGEPPQPTTDGLVDWPIAPKVWAGHVPIETVLDRYEGWT